MIAWVIIGGTFFFASCFKGDKEDKEKAVGQQRMKEHGMPADWKFTLPKGNPVQGRKIFLKMECYKCHEIMGETFPAVAEKERGIGPELSQMAGMHPVEFFAESIINPNAVVDPKAKELGYVGEDGKSKMPEYSDVLTVRQAVDLAAYLTALKGMGHSGH